jgi:hypothetical protein
MSQFKGLKRGEEMTRNFLRIVVITLVPLFMVACATPTSEQATDQSKEEITDPSTDPESIEPDEQSEPEATPAHEEPMEEINPFEEGLSGGNVDEFPFPAADDATNFDNLMGLYSYTTNFDMERLVELYNAAIPTLGYSLNSDTVITDMAILSFEGDGEVLTLNISKNEDGTNEVSILLGVLQ